MPILDTTRFDGLSETEVLRRIGALLASAIARSGRRRLRNARSADQGTALEPRIDPLRLIADPLARQIAEFLRTAEVASPLELRRALGLRQRSLTRALARLRSGGLCEVTGRTRAVRYRLRQDFSQN